jgi:hypothetical protein
LISSHDEKAIMRMISEQETAEKDYGKTEESFFVNIPSSLFLF